MLFYIFLQELRLWAMASLLILSACGMTTGAMSPITETISGSGSGKKIKIVAADGSASLASSLSVGQSMNVKCILVDSSGKSLGDSNCYWTVGGGGIVTDISPQGTASKSATYSPTSVGFAYLTAMYSGDDNDVSSTVANTPALSIQSNQVIQSISSYAGNTQAAIVGQSLSSQLQARVLDSFGLPVAGVSVTFSVQQGGYSYFKRGWAI